MKKLLKNGAGVLIGLAIWVFIIWGFLALTSGPDKYAYEDGEFVPVEQIMKDAGRDIGGAFLVDSPDYGYDDPHWNDDGTEFLAP